MKVLQRPKRDSLHKRKSFLKDMDFIGCPATRSGSMIPAIMVTEPFIKTVRNMFYGLRYS